MNQKNTYIIAEAGVNHNGSLDIAKRLIEIAAEAGADAIKFQSFKADKLVTCSAPKANYQITTTNPAESQYEMLKCLEFDEQAHDTLTEYCKNYGVVFLSTPFDLDSVDLLVGRYNLPCIKISSGDITNAPLLLKIAQTGKPVILSTGMSSLGDIEGALGVLAFGYLNAKNPNQAAFREAYLSDVGYAILQDKVTLLHCTTEYPASPIDVNLKAMDTLQVGFGLPVGLSDHTEGIVVPIAAVARGAVIVEKHFTLDRTMSGPDHSASLEPSELKEMVRSIRIVEQSLGSSRKHATQIECKNSLVARKSLVAATEINCGEPFTENNLNIKRPGDGVSPMMFWDILNKKAVRYFSPDERIEL